MNLKLPLVTSRTISFNAVAWALEPFTSSFGRAPTISNSASMQRSTPCVSTTHLR